MLSRAMTLAERLILDELSDGENRRIGEFQKAMWKRGVGRQEAMIALETLDYFGDVKIHGLSSVSLLPKEPSGCEQCGCEKIGRSR